MGIYNDDVLFIHIPKCGGTAVKEYMNEHLDGIKWPRNADHYAMEAGRDEPSEADEARAAETVAESKLPIGHVPLRDIPAFTGRPLDSWKLILATIRNPYYQQISQWLFWRDRYARGMTHPHDMKAAAHPRFDSWVGTPDADFHIWYEHRKSAQAEFARHPPSAKTKYEKWGGFYPYWLSVDNSIPDNLTMVRQETMDVSVVDALSPFIKGEPPPMKHANKGPGRESDYLDYICDWESVDTIERKFKWCFAEGIYDKVER